MKVSGVLLGLALLGVAKHARAQQEIDGVEVAPKASPVTRASYVSIGRRDPFEPLTGAYASDDGVAPRLEQLELTGVFLGTPGNSLAVLEDRTRHGHFVRVGESLGKARLLEILSDAAVFEVDDYGIVRRDTLRLVPDRVAPQPSEPVPASPPPEEAP